MTKRGGPKNIGASVRARLTDSARRRGEDVQLVLRRFAIERFMFRLSQSRFCDEFVLKGAMLFSLWAPVPYRSTGDLDLLGHGDPAPARIVRVFREICATDAPDDGMTFLSDTVVAEPVREGEAYGGVRVELDAILSGALLRVRVDIGFGDVVVPKPELITYPSLLDLPAPQMRAYPPETVVAEKLEALVSLGMRNSRMKDFLDLWVISETFGFDGRVLSRAIAATFERRGTRFPAEVPIALTAAFAEDAAKQTQWRGFIERTKMTFVPQPLTVIVGAIARFVSPALEALRKGSELQRDWPRGGPWS